MTQRPGFIVTTQKTTYPEIERLVKSFKGMPFRVDEEIDKRVYVLFGLTEEEITIVEG